MTYMITDKYILDDIYFVAMSSEVGVKLTKHITDQGKLTSYVACAFTRKLELNLLINVHICSCGCTEYDRFC